MQFLLTMILKNQKIKQQDIQTQITTIELHYQNIYYKSDQQQEIQTDNYIINLYFQQQYFDKYLVQATDTSEIQRNLIESLRQIITELIAKQMNINIYGQIKQIILGTLMQLLKSDNLDIKQQSAKLILFGASRLNKKQLQIISNRAIQMLLDVTNQQNKIVGIEIICKLAAYLQKKQNQQLIQKYIIQSTNMHYSTRVKKQLILGLVNIIKNVSEDFKQSKLMPFYFKKCQENVWNIRKACVQIIDKLFLLTTLTQNQQKLHKLLLYFLKDGNKNVRIEAHKQLPVFLGTIQKTKLYNSPDALKLADQYFKLIDSQLNNQVTANQIYQRIAFNFPAVLSLYGTQKWKQLYVIFQKLFKIFDKNIKMPLGCSLHVIGKIIGPQNSKKYLFNYLDLILKDHNQDLKMGTIEHLSEFVSLFNQQTKENLIDVFLVLQKDPRKWRIRECIAGQIQKLAKLYDEQTVFKYILPISFKLCSDPVSDVRIAASKNIWVFLQIFKQQSAFLYVTIESIKGFGSSLKYNQRQSFLIMCKEMIKFQQIFISDILGLIEQLLKDNILVKILLAELISKIMGIKDNNLKNNQKIRQIYKKLKQETQQDILDALV